MPENNNSVERAEQRVREMDRVTRQLSEQGNRYMRDMQNRRTANAVPRENQNIHNAPPRRQIGNMGTRFEPVEKERNVPQISQAEKAAELPKHEEKPAPQKAAQRSAPRSAPNQGIDGEKLLLIALMYLLMTENADIKLILAIGYLIL